MRNKNKLIFDQLNRKLEPFQHLKQESVPERGWIYTIRKSLNMTLEQLGNRMEMKRDGVRKLEQREEKGTISLRRLKEVGQALDMKLVYGFVSNYDSIDQMVDKKARNISTKIILRTHQNMQLENQGTSDIQIKNAIDELTLEIKREMRRSLWD